MIEPSARRRELEELLERCHGRLLARIRWMLGARARQTAESGDFMASVSVKLLEDADVLHWNDEMHFLNLATRIVRNQLIDRQRQHRAERFARFTTSFGVADSHAPGPIEASEFGEQVDILLGALEALPASYQRVIELRHFEELAFGDIAGRLGGTENSVEILHRRAVAKLGAMLRRD